MHKYKCIFKVKYMEVILSNIALGNCYGIRRYEISKMLTAV